MRRLALLALLPLVLLASACAEDPDGSIAITNETDSRLTISYDDPTPQSNVSPEQQEDMNRLAVIDPGDKTNVNVPEANQCARVPVEAIDDSGTVVDSLPEGTCHADDYVEWTITEP